MDFTFFDFQTIQCYVCQDWLPEAEMDEHLLGHIPEDEPTEQQVN